MTLKRCSWVDLNNLLYVNYHDNEWGVPVHDDNLLFEMLILEGAQAGLSWATVLKKREAYRKLFFNFDPKKVAELSDLDLERILEDASIIRNRLKIFSVRQNAKVFLQIQLEFGSFDKYIWKWTAGEQIKNSWKSFSELPSKTLLSDLISKDLKKRGMNFVGSTIIYAYMQAIGIVDDHFEDCWKRSSQKDL